MLDRVRRMRFQVQGWSRQFFAETFMLSTGQGEKLSVPGKWLAPEYVDAIRRAQ
jgi:hypothetical protein